MNICSGYASGFPNRAGFGFDGEIIRKPQKLDARQLHPLQFVVFSPNEIIRRQG